MRTPVHFCESFFHGGTCQIGACFQAFEFMIKSAIHVSERLARSRQVAQEAGPFVCKPNRGKTLEIYVNPSFSLEIPHCTLDNITRRFAAVSHAEIHSLRVPQVREYRVCECTEHRFNNWGVRLKEPLKAPLFRSMRGVLVREFIIEVTLSIQSRFLQSIEETHKDAKPSTCTSCRERGVMSAAILPQ
jgi:hypothetical protein